MHLWKYVKSGAIMTVLFSFLGSLCPALPPLSYPASELAYPLSVSHSPSAYVSLVLNMSSSKAFRTYHGDSSQDSYRPRKELERRKRHALKALAGLMLSHNTVDFRVVKRFRFWQVRIFKEKIIAFKRLLRSTNRNYLSSRLRVLQRIFNSGLSSTLVKWRLGEARVQVPQELRPSLAAGKLGALVQYYQAKLRLYSHFRQPLGSRHVLISKTDWTIWASASERRAFDVWLSKTYRPEPLLHRKLQLLLQVKVLIERRLVANKSQAWKAIQKHTAFPFITPLVATLRIALYMNLRSGWEKLRTAQVSKSGDRLRVMAGVQALAGLTHQRLQLQLALLWSFRKWQQTPKSADIYSVLKAFRRIGRLGVKRAFYALVLGQKKETDWEVDKSIIANQALLLVHLEKELMRRAREEVILKKAYSLHVLNSHFHSRLRSYLDRWSDSCADLAHEKDEIFSYVQQLEAGAGLRLVPEGEEELSGSRFSEFESIRAKIGRRSADSTVLESE